MATTMEEMQAMKDAGQVFELLSTESYYGFNFRVVLAQATQEERDAVRKIVERAKAERLGIEKARFPVQTG